MSLYGVTSLASVESMSPVTSCLCVVQILVIASRTNFHWNLFMLRLWTMYLGSCMYVCTYVCVYVLCMVVCMYVYIYMIVCMYGCMYVCMCVCMYDACMRMCVCMMYGCMYVCMCVCMYVCSQLAIHIIYSKKIHQYVPTFRCRLFRRVNNSRTFAVYKDVFKILTSVLGSTPGNTALILIFSGAATAFGRAGPSK